MHPDSCTLRVTVMIKKHWLIHRNLVLTWDNQSGKGKKGRNVGTWPRKTRLGELSTCWDSPATKNIHRMELCLPVFHGFWELHAFTVHSHCCVEYSIRFCCIPSWCAGRSGSFSLFCVCSFFKRNPQLKQVRILPPTIPSWELLMHIDKHWHKGK